MTRCACICARWARWKPCRAPARSLSPSASRPAALGYDRRICAKVRSPFRPSSSGVTSCATKFCSARHRRSRVDVCGQQTPRSPLSCSPEVVTAPGDPGGVSGEPPPPTAAAAKAPPSGSIPRASTLPAGSRRRTASSMTTRRCSSSSPLRRSRQSCKPKALETFDSIADCYTGLRRLGRRLPRPGCTIRAARAGLRAGVRGVKEKMIAALKSLCLNQTRIDTLIEQLHDINKRLIGSEGRLMRLAERHSVAREEFLRRYRGSELDPHWIAGIAKLSATGWKAFAVQDRDAIEGIRRDIAALVEEAGLEIGSSAGSCGSCKQASAKRARRRRSWWRQIFASSSGLRRDTPIEVCSFSTSYRKATSD